MGSEELGRRCLFATLSQIRFGTRKGLATGISSMISLSLNNLNQKLFVLEASVKNSKLILSAAIAVSAILGGAASAADLAVKARPYPVAAAPVYSWTGCYVGVHAGAGVLLDQGFQSQVGGVMLIDGGSLADRHGVGGLAGGQIGCNYQTGMLVLGIEGEGFWSGHESYPRSVWVRYF